MALLGMETGKFKSDAEGLNGGFVIDTRLCGDLTKPQRAIMVFVDFPNAQASDLQNRYGSFEYYYDLLAVEGLEFFAKASFGKVSLTIDKYDKWFRMPLADSEYHMGRVITDEVQRNYIREVIKVSENEIEYSQYDYIYIVPPKNAVHIPYSPTCVSKDNPVQTEKTSNGLAVTFGQDMHRRRGLLLVHESGHLTGLPDYYIYDTSQVGAFGYIGGWDVMGWIEGRAPDFLAYAKWRYGWFADDQVFVCTKPGTQEYTITPVELEKGKKMVVIPVDDYCGYVVESRRGLALDRALEDRQGALIYYVDGHIRGGAGCVKVMPPQAERLYKLDRDDNEELFGTCPGQTDTFTDEARGITISVVKSGPVEDTIRVTRA